MNPVATTLVLLALSGCASVPQKPEDVIKHEVEITRARLAECEMVGCLVLSNPEIEHLFYLGVQKGAEASCKLKGI